MAGARADVKRGTSSDLSVDRREARAPLGMAAAVPLPAPPQPRARPQPGLSPPGASPRRPAPPLAPLPKPPQLRSPLPPLQPAASTAALPQPSRPPLQPAQQPPLGSPTPGRNAGARADVKRGTSSDLSVDRQEAPNVLLLVPGSPKLLAWEVG